MRFEDAHKIMRLMRRLAMAQRARKSELLREHGLQPGQDVVLMELALAGSLSQRQLAAAAEVDEPSIGRSVARLERRILVTRADDPNDSRRRVVTLTDEGKALIPELRKIYLTIAAEAVGDFKDLEWLAEHLTEIAERLGQAPAGVRA